MALPPFNTKGDLPEGVYSVTIEEVQARFGIGSVQRRQVTERLLRIYQLAKATGLLDRLVVFGSYVTDKPEPNDVDVVIVMHDEFRPRNCPAESHSLFDHGVAEADFGASIFWVRPGMLLRETVDEFVAHWQIKRDQSRRGILELRP
jgi:hypothetical protein